MQKLNNNLKDAIKNWSNENQQNEYLDINNYIFFSNNIKSIDEFNEFELKFKKKNEKRFKVKKYDELTINNILHFIKSNNIPTNNILDIKVFMSNEYEKLSRELSKIIIYDCVDENCTYEYGKWTEYNQDYINMIEKEIDKISAKFYPEYSFETKEYDDYITKRINSTKKEDESINEKKYNETVFNEYLGECHGYTYYDKDLWRDRGYSVEVMDLYKDGVAYSVKKGSGAQKLSYVVDQSIEGIKILRNEDTKFDEKIEKVGIWIILDNKKPIHDENNNVDLNKLKVLILKIKIVAWAQQMRQWGYEPIIRINYKKKNDKDDKK